MCVQASRWLPRAAEDIEIPYRKFTLDNGLTLIVHEDDKAPVVAVNIWYHVGSKNEVPGRTGFAHLFEHLMFQGSENYDDEYLLFLQQLGATNLNATTWFDRTNYFETIPKNALDTVLWLESDRMGHFAGAITQAKLDEQRGVVQNEKRQSDNQPYGKVWTYMLKQLFPTAIHTRGRRSVRWQTSTTRRSMTSKNGSPPTTDRTMPCCRSPATSIQMMYDEWSRNTSAIYPRVRR